MIRRDHLKDYVIFLTLYLLLSLIPFLAINREHLGDMRVWVARDVVTVAIIGVTVLLVLTALWLADEGVDRYTYFLFTPTDVLSVIIELAFVVAAISWWVVPELVTRYDWGLTVGEILVVIIVCHVPMVIFLSLMTALGKA